MKFTRRKFLESAGLLSLAPISLSSLLPARTIARSRASNTIGDTERIQKILKDKPPAIWVFTGDSITAGVKHTEGYRSYPEVFGERIRWELNRRRDIIINSAISGNTSQNIVDDFDWRVKQFNPTVVSLMIGTNDCSDGGKISLQKFEENLIFLIEGIRKLGAIPILQTPNVIIEAHAPERAKLPKYVETIRRVADDQGTILVDNWAHWQESMIQNGPAKVFKEWLNDPLHPSGGGHSEIARLLFKELSIFNAADPTCGGAYYEGVH